MTATTPAARRVSQAEALALWRRYRSTGDARLRDRLIMTYAPLVKFIVYRKIREVPAHQDRKGRLVAIAGAPHQRVVAFLQHGSRPLAAGPDRDRPSAPPDRRHPTPAQGIAKE